MIYFRLIHIDNPMRGVGASSDQSSSIQNVMVTFDSWAKADKESSDPICAIAASEKVLLAARSSGTVNVYSLPKMSFNNKLQTDIRAYNLYINCNSTLVCTLSNCPRPSLDEEIKNNESRSMVFSNLSEQNVYVH